MRYFARYVFMYVLNASLYFRFVLIVGIGITQADGNKNNSYKYLISELTCC